MPDHLIAAQARDFVAQVPCLACPPTYREAMRLKVSRRPRVPAAAVAALKNQASAA